MHICLTTYPPFYICKYMYISTTYLLSIYHFNRSSSHPCGGYTCVFSAHFEIHSAAAKPQHKCTICTLHTVERFLRFSAFDESATRQAQNKYLYVCGSNNSQAHVKNTQTSRYPHTCKAHKRNWRTFNADEMY